MCRTSTLSCRRGGFQYISKDTSSSDWSTSTGTYHHKRPWRVALSVEDDDVVGKLCVREGVGLGEVPQTDRSLLVRHIDCAYVPQYFPLGICLFHLRFHA